MSEVELVHDEHGGVSVVVGGQPQSYVSLDDPEGLVFEYVQHLAAVVDAILPAPAHPRVAITHVGGAGLSLPRWVHATRPGSPQVVLEPDTALTELVRRELPLPRGHRIRVRPQRGREGVAALADASADVVVVDAFADGAVPADLVTQEFFADVARVLRPGGVVLMNCPDDPGLRYLVRVAAGMREGVGPVALVALRDVLKGRRYGNAVLVASPDGVDADAITRQLRRWPFPSGVMTPGELLARAGGARPIHDDEDVPPPTAPDPGAWRVR
ncbi:spermidine synthase [Janibacter melonis]|uniref:spermidine synthase n=1 Tax=Janibacter melonis TaxID=262209 RepID=UPI0019185A2A|nr:fused MFS/spermidine synthase [Janibacter melonis]